MAGHQLRLQQTVGDKAGQLERPSSVYNGLTVWSALELLLAAAANYCASDALSSQPGHFSITGMQVGPGVRDMCVADKGLPPPITRTPAYTASRFPMRKWCYENGVITRACFFRIQSMCF